MGYEFVKGAIYRMPTHFGPALGPRQMANGSPRAGSKTSPHTHTTAVSFRTDPAKLTVLMPPGFELGQPIVSITCTYMKEIDWLAGRGYNVVGVNVPVTYYGKREVISGLLRLVTWESLADPIITGREELGFPKVYGEIPDLEWERARGRARTQVGWGGFKFLEYEITNMVEKPIDTAEERVPGLHVKYVPRTGEWGEADVCYVTVNGLPKPGSQPVPRQNWVTTVKRFTGKGSVAFNHATWEQLPTLSNIVNPLADLDVFEVVAASLTETIGSAGLRGVRIVE
ncbi:MAG: acetoacetate decarboxylase family protein [Deltaproteobacteria bacterium]|nr:acetoacetate decarboxylase family protein [Deltaproteobacteria bacterium]